MKKLKSRTMQDGFEKDVQKRLQDFNLEPSPQVWNEIDAAISEKKRRRFAIWWWLLPLLLAGGSIIWLYRGNNNRYNPSVAKSQNGKAEEKKNYTLKEKKNETTNEDVNVKKRDDAVNSNRLGEDDDGLDLNTGKIKNETATDAKILNQKNTEKAANQIAESSKVEEEITNKVEPSQIDKKIIQQKNESISTLRKTDSSNELTSPFYKKAPSSSQASLKDSDIKVVQNVSIQNGKRKRGNWLITIGAGITSTKENGGNSLLSNDSEDKSLNPADGPTGGPSTNSPDSSYKIIKPDNGHHFAAGIIYQYPFSKKWIVSSGLQYRFLTNKQQGGKHVDSSFSVSVENYSSLISVTGYYRAGYKHDITNKAHWFEIPLNIAYNINPSAKTKIQLSAGASYARMFAEKWLIPDSRNNRLYYNEQLLHNSIFNWQVGTDITFSPGWTIGLQFQQSISTVASKSVEPSLYWQNLSLHMAFPLQLKNITHSLF
jgi:hypothetical protein